MYWLKTWALELELCSNLDSVTLLTRVTVASPLYSLDVQKLYNMHLSHRIIMRIKERSFMRNHLTQCPGKLLMNIKY